jgi:oligosaccharide repeat unit polymerase
VYTTFYEFFSDFGFVGPLLLCFIMGIISEYLFKKTKGEGKNQYLHLILYGYVAPLLIFSFFSNRFFSYFVTIQMVIKVFWIWMINYFMKAKTPFKKIRWRR